MLSRIKNHPFAVDAFFEHSLVLTFSAPKAQLEKLVPACLELDTLDDQYGFIAVAMVQTKELRPAGFPRFTGHDFFLIGYRIFVRYRNMAGKSLRGLYILKSETNKRKMEILGNVFTNYHYTTTDITKTQSGTLQSFASVKSGFSFSIDTGQEAVSLPPTSPFTDWKAARRFAGPLPFTFSVDEEKKTVLIIEGQRQNWLPQPVQVTDYRFSFLDALQLSHVHLANAFEIANVPYHWKKGRTEIWE